MSPQAADPRKYATYLATRPPQFEQDAIRMLLDVLAHAGVSARRGFFLHIAHLGDAASVPALKVCVHVCVCLWGGGDE
jgi:allantoinase